MGLPGQFTNSSVERFSPAIVKSHLGRTQCSGAKGGQVQEVMTSLWAGEWVVVIAGTGLGPAAAVTARNWISHTSISAYSAAHSQHAVGGGRSKPTHSRNYGGSTSLRYSAGRWNIGILHDANKLRILCFSSLVLQANNAKELSVIIVEYIT